MGTALLRWKQMCLIAAVAALPSCGSLALRLTSTPELCRELDNDRFRSWDIQFDHMVALADGPVEREIVRRGMRSVLYLKEALHDETRFAAAHALLCIIVHDGIVPRTALWYNGLKFKSFTADGRAIIVPSSRAGLVKQWQGNGLSREEPPFFWDDVKLPDDLKP